MDREAKDQLQCNEAFNSPETPSETATHKIEERYLYVSPIIITLQQNVPSSTETACKSFRSTPSSLGAVCRICHDDDKNGMLISPCDCIGTLGLIHINCLEKWLSASNTDRCEICKFRFKTSRKPKPFTEWLKSKDKLGPRAMIGDLLCLLLLTPLSLASVYLCSFGAFIYMNHGAWEGTGLAVLGCFLMTAFTLWCVVTVRYHWKLLKEWQRKNQTVHLVLSGQKTLNECVGSRALNVQVTSPSQYEEIEMNIFI